MDIKKQELFHWKGLFICNTYLLYTIEFIGDVSISALVAVFGILLVINSRFQN